MSIFERIGQARHYLRCRSQNILAQVKAIAPTNLALSTDVKEGELAKQIHYDYVHAKGTWWQIQMQDSSQTMIEATIVWHHACRSEGNYRVLRLMISKKSNKLIGSTT